MTHQCASFEHLRTSSLLRLSSGQVLPLSAFHFSLHCADRTDVDQVTIAQTSLVWLATPPPRWRPRARASLAAPCSPHASRAGQPRAPVNSHRQTATATVRRLPISQRPRPISSLIVCPYSLCPFIYSLTATVQYTTSSSKLHRPITLRRACKRPGSQHPACISPAPATVGIRTLRLHYAEVLRNRENAGAHFIMKIEVGYVQCWV